MWSTLGLCFKIKSGETERLPQQPQHFMYEVDPLLAFPWSVVSVFVYEEFEEISFLFFPVLLPFLFTVVCFTTACVLALDRSRIATSSSMLYRTDERESCYTAFTFTVSVLSWATSSPLYPPPHTPIASASLVLPSTPSTVFSFPLTPIPLSFKGSRPSK